MPNNYKNLFLKQGYEEALCEYERLLERGNGAEHWDYIVLTASGEAQAEAYRKQIESRLARGRLPSDTRYIVVSDPGGKRVGSGGATLNVLREIAADNAADRSDKPVFEGLKILCIHSGGDSRRIPQYSAQGKLFSPVPRLLPDGRSSTLFDEFMIGMCGVPKRMRDGMLVCSGDVLLLFDPLQLDYFSCGACAISVKVDAGIGSSHGVYCDDGFGNVRRFMHKKPVEILAEAKAIDRFGNVNIDTGAVLFDSEILRRLYSLADTEEKFQNVVNEHVRLSFYADFLYPLSTESTLENYLVELPEGDFSSELDSVRQQIWEKLSCYSMRLTVFSPGAFLHFGTTRELLHLMTEDIGDYSYLGWRPLINTNVAPEVALGKNIAVNGSYVSCDAVIHGDCYIEDSYICAGAEIGRGCVVSGVTLPRGAYVPDGTAIHGTELYGGKYTAALYGISDNPKTFFHLGKPIGCVLWRAKLFPVCDSMEEAVIATLRLYAGNGGTSELPLISLAESFERAADRTYETVRNALLLKIKTDMYLQGIRDGVPASKLNYTVNHDKFVMEYLKSDWVRAVMNEAEALDTAIPEQMMLKMRIYAYLATVGTVDGDEMTGKSFGALREGMLKSISGLNLLSDRVPVEHQVTVRHPFRVNFGGGWTDTPPYCIENGGCVLNAAASFNRKLPIGVTVTHLDEEKVEIYRAESGALQVFDRSNFAELMQFDQSEDPSLLHKAALVACGLLPIDGVCDALSVADRFFARLKGGISIATEADLIPNGSGLGTSSILAGSCVEAICALFGLQIRESALWKRVLYMEQLMFTGGGWQDQVGGISDGIKLITSEKGLDQIMKCQPIRLSPEMLSRLEERLVLIYTGQRRLAKNLLRQVMGEYIRSEEYAIETLEKLGEVAFKMKDALENGDIDGFAALLNENLLLTEKFDCGCLNDCIREIFKAVECLVCGKMICGAGGGGYLQVVLKKGVTLTELQKRLFEVFGESDISAHQIIFEIKAE
ncbi:MAG: bifunctional fucokinase/L-fucose-1-P-guanylyltransferase [Clostridia bacterium]|nr:bifunctional fucokinase/L-fucose-1-P-guanylyltransferase [Clostridia bacterium]